MIRLLLKLIGWLLTLAMLGLVALGVLVYLDSGPLVAEERVLSSAERAWAEQWLRAARPSGLREGERTTLTLTEDQAEIIGVYLMDKVGHGRIAVALEQGQARLAVSLGLPWDPHQHFLNLQAQVSQSEGLPQLDSARLAGLPLPGLLVENGAERLIAALGERGLLKRVELGPGLARLTYEWRRDSLDQVGSDMLSSADREAVLHYQAKLAAFSALRPAGMQVELAPLLTELLMEAAHRSAAADPAAENRAALMALAAYANGRRIHPEDEQRDTAAHQVPSRFVRLILRDRHDLALHFLTSAGLTAQGGNVLSDLIGLYKELSDSDGGSGFSFKDLAADRAGTRFAQRAIGSREGALWVQQLARRGLQEDDFMPRLIGLPEGLSQAEFEARFQSTRSAAYRRLAQEIERRLDQTNIHRDG